MNLKEKINLKTTVPFVVLILALFVPAVLQSNYYIQVACTMLLYSYFASCWNLIGGLAGQFALGNGLYLGIGAYCCAIAISEGGTPFTAIPIAIVVSIVIAFIVSSLCFRLSGTYFSLATVAFLYIARYIMVGTNSLFGFRTNAGMGMTVPWKGGWKYLQFTNKAVYYYIFLAMVVAILLITHRIMKTRMGYYLTAIRTNQGAAATIGIPVTRYKMYAQCLSASMMALGGILYATFIMQVDPYTVLGYDLSLQIMMFCVIGGRGTLFGPVIGGSLLMLFKEVARVKLGTDVAQLSLVLFGVMLIVCIMFAPGGLVGLFNQVMAKIRTKQAAKKQLAMQAEVAGKEEGAA